MANIIFATFTNLPGGILDSFRQAFVDALVREGNNVLLFITNDFLCDHHSSNILAPNIDKDRLIKSITNFKPDLFISVNNSGLFPRLSQVIDCPIAIWLLDGPAYLVDAEECRQQNSRYHMFIATRNFRSDLHQYFNTPDAHIHDLPLASDFQAVSENTASNISFVGTYFTGYKFKEILDSVCTNQDTISKIRSLTESYQTDKNSIFQDRLVKHRLENLFTGQFDEAYILNTLSINNRVKVLDAVQDLGLSLYGTNNWTETLHYSLGLALSFNPRPILTKSDLEHVYNTSRISLNISHTQARGGLPWRIFDIMSSNSVLVSDPQEDLKRFFPNIPIPTYTSPAECRDICQHLLKDEVRRHYLVQSCNQAIESGHRFKHRLNSISDIFGINLTPSGAGILNKLNSTEFADTKREISLLDILDKMVQINGNEARNIFFPLQLFHSDLMNFADNNGSLLNIDISLNRHLHAEMEIKNASAFLRLDIGEYFSKHIKVKITITQKEAGLDTDTYANSYCIDINRDILHSNGFHFSDDIVFCGHDSFIVVENPFPQKDIRITFESLLLSYLHPDHYALFEDMVNRTINKSHNTKTLLNVYSTFTENSRMDIENFTNFLFAAATINNTAKNDKPLLRPKTKAKLFYNKIKAKYNTLLAKTN